MMSDQAYAHGSAGAGERLAAFGRVFTTDVDEAADEIGRIFCPHGLDPIDGTASTFHARHNSAAFDGFSVNYVSYGGSVTIDPGCLDKFFLLQIPVRGTATIKTAGREIDTAAGRLASLLTPTRPTQMVWTDCAQLILLVDRQMLERRAAALAETSVRPVEFDPVVDLATPLGHALQGQIDYLAAISERHGPDHQLAPAAIAMLRESVLALLLTGQQHSLSEAIAHQDARPQVVPGSLKKARAYLEAHAAEPLALDQFARDCGIGVRSLQIGFRRHYGLSISEALLDIRLNHLRQRLITATPGARVIDIAFDLGFTHLGRMAKAYQIKFGQKPSDTMRRSL